jgi:hypothetical protein
VLWLFLLTLGYSRYLTGAWSLQGDLAAVLQGHLLAFQALGGAPHRMLYDRMKAVVRHTDPAGRPVFHPALLALATHYGFTPEACRPYRAQTKGKVERLVGYIREDFWLGRTFRDFADLSARWREWLATVANVRIHGTTGVRHALRLVNESAVKSLDEGFEETPHLAPARGLRGAGDQPEDHQRRRIHPRPGRPTDGQGHALAHLGPEAALARGRAPRHRAAPPSG